MKNITDYVVEYDKTFAEAELTDIDSLVFTQLSYLYLDTYIKNSNKDWFTLEELAKTADESVCSVRKSKKFSGFLMAVGESARFKDVVVSNYVNIIDEEKEIQFSATVYRFCDKAFVAFRGTDATLVGWKEDFNYLYNEVIPSQYEAVKYLNDLENVLPKEIYVGGHSKGGLVSAYASAMCKQSVQDKIIAIYNHDSPGLNEKIRNTENYGRIKDKVFLTIPQGSLFGLINNCVNECRIVKSNGLLFQQHEPFTWNVENNDLVFLEDITENSKRISHAINQWLLETDEKSKELFFTTVYGVAASTQEKTVRALGVNLIKNLPIIIRSCADVDKETAMSLVQMINKFVQLLREYNKLNKTEEKPSRLQAIKNIILKDKND